MLAVDDDPEMLAVYKLGMKGYNVATAKSPKEALEMLTKQHYVFVVTDLFMPGIRNIEAGLDYVRQLCGFGSPVIVASGSVHEGVERLIEEAGARAFIPKASGIIFRQIESILKENEPAYH